MLVGTIRTQLRVPTRPSRAVEAVEGGQRAIPRRELRRLEDEVVGVDLRGAADDGVIVHGIAGGQPLRLGEGLPVLAHPFVSRHVHDGETVARRDVGLDRDGALHPGDGGVCRDVRFGDGDVVAFGIDDDGELGKGFQD